MSVQQDFGIRVQASQLRVNHMFADIKCFLLNDGKDTNTFTMYCNVVDSNEIITSRQHGNKSTVLSYRMSIPYPLVKEHSKLTDVIFK